MSGSGNRQGLANVKGAIFEWERWEGVAALGNMLDIEITYLKDVLK